MKGEDWSEVKPNWSGIRGVEHRIPAPEGSNPKFPSAEVFFETHGSLSAPSPDDPETSPFPLKVYLYYKKKDWIEPRLCSVQLQCVAEPNPVDE